MQQRQSAFGSELTRALPIGAIRSDKFHRGSLPDATYGNRRQ